LESYTYHRSKTVGHTVCKLEFFNDVSSTELVLFTDNLCKKMTKLNVSLKIWIARKTLKFG